MKPFSFQRFITAVNKVNDSLSKHFNSIKDTKIESTNLFLKDNKKHYQIKLKNILFIEAYGNYVKVYLEDQMIITHQTLVSFEKFLPVSQFVKVHKSFIIAIDKINLVEGNRVFIQTYKIPIGKMYKLNISKLIK